MNTNKQRPRLAGTRATEHRSDAIFRRISQRDAARAIESLNLVLPATGSERLRELRDSLEAAAWIARWKREQVECELPLTLVTAACEELARLPDESIQSDELRQVEQALRSLLQLCDAAVG